MTVARSLARSAALGLVAALSIAAVVLVTLAVLRLQVDCTGLSSDECHFEEQLAASIARLQTFAAVGCAAIAGGCFLVARAR